MQCNVLRRCCKASILVVIVGRAIGQSTTAVEDCYKIGDYEERCFKTIRSDRGFLMRLWPEAKDLCTEGNDGYTLATIRDDATQEALASFIINYEVTTRNVWIGARQNMNSRWAWLDGTVEPGELYHVHRIDYCVTQITWTMWFCISIVIFMHETSCFRLCPFVSESLKPYKHHIQNKRLCYCRGTARRATSVEILWPFLTELLTRSSANPEEPCEHTVS